MRLMAVLRCFLPTEVMRQAWLPPHRRLAPCRRNRGWIASLAQVNERAAERIEVFEHHPVLNDVVRLTHFVDGAAGVQINRASVDPLVDLEQRHADSIELPVPQSPETHARIAILGSDAGMHP